MVSQFLEECVR